METQDTQTVYQCRYDPYTGKPKLRMPSGRRDLLLAGLLAIILGLLSDTLFYASAGLGMSVCLTLALAAEVWYLCHQGQKWTFYAVFCVLGALALAVSLTFSDDGWLKFFAFVGCVGLMTLLPVELWQQRKHRAGSFFAIADFFSMLFVRTFGRLGGGFWALLHKDGETDTRRGRGLIPVLIGVGVAIPALAMVIPLLMSSDAAFDGMMNSIDLGDLPGHLIAVLFGLFLALLVFSQLFSVRHGREAQTQKQPSDGWLDPAIAVSFLTLLSAVYTLYLISQGAYFFDGFRGLLPKGYTVAEYARRGFFEMSLVCVLNLGFLLLAQLLTKKKDGIAPLPVRILSLFVCVFSLVLVATSISKMFLYIHSFGLTRLRILTSAFMLFLACVFVAAALRLFIRQIPYMKVAVIAATVIVLGLSFANVDRLVASYNVRAYQTGKLDSIDVPSLNVLSDASVPYLIELLDDTNPSVAREAKSDLIHRANRHFENPRWIDGNIQFRPKSGRDLRSYNTVSAQAARLIQENAAKIFG